MAWCSRTLLVIFSCVVAACGTAAPDAVTAHGLQLYTDGFEIAPADVNAVTERVMEAMQWADPGTYSVDAMREALLRFQPRVFFVDGRLDCGNSDGGCLGRYEHDSNDITVVYEERVYNTVLPHELIHFFRNRIGGIDENGGHDPKYYETFESVENMSTNYACFDIDRLPFCAMYIRDVGPEVMSVEP